MVVNFCVLRLVFSKGSVDVQEELILYNVGCIYIVIKYTSGEQYYLHKQGTLTMLYILL